MEFEQKWVTTEDGNRMLLTTAILTDAKKVGPVRTILPLDEASNFRQYHGEGIEKMLESASKAWMVDLTKHS